VISVPRRAAISAAVPYSWPSIQITHPSYASNSGSSSARSQRDPLQEPTTAGEDSNIPDTPTPFVGTDQRSSRVSGRLCKTVPGEPARQAAIDSNGDSNRAGRERTSAAEEGRSAEVEDTAGRVRTRRTELVSETSRGGPGRRLRVGPVGERQRRSGTRSGLATGQGVGVHWVAFVRQRYRRPTVRARPCEKPNCSNAEPVYALQLGVKG
jgi:hypothetical protein